MKMPVGSICFRFGGQKVFNARSADTTSFTTLEPANYTNAGTVDTKHP